MYCFLARGLHSKRRCPALNKGRLRRTMEQTNEIREKIINAARQKMREVGIRSVSIDDICHELGMSKKTFYVYFATKDDLIQAILDYHYSNVEHGMEEFFASCGSLWHAIERVMEQLSSMPDVRRSLPFVYDMNKYYPAMAKKHYEDIFVLHERAMRKVIVMGKQEGLFRQTIDDDLAANLLARLHTDVIQDGIKHDGNGVSFKRLGDFAIDVMLRGMFTEEGLHKYEALLKSK